VKVRRLAAGDDLAAAVALLQRFFAEEGFPTPAEVIAARTAELAANGNCGLFVAEDGARAVGVATVSLEFGIEYGWWAEMGDLYVVPDQRGQGVARRVVAAIEAFLEARGAGGYQVTVMPAAEEAHGLGRFYEALGFAGEGRLILRKVLAVGKT
jgi:GNAT superfamily N-acetyltransferase